jgi:hypothetical protein
MKTKFLCLCSLIAMLSCVRQAAAQGTAFSYQGQLSASGSAANGNYDFTFALFNTNSTNSGQIGGTLTNLDLAVSNGLFAVTLDFGGVFAGNATWLAIGVRSNGGNSFTALSPLQELTPVPYAIMANSASNLLGSLSAAQLPAGVVTNNDTASVTLNGTFSGNGAGLSNLNVGGFTGTATNLTLGTLTLTSNLFLPATTPSAGIIYSAGSTLIHAYGTNNFFAGARAGNLTMTGGANTANGATALQANTAGSNNTAGGYGALYANTSGHENTAYGAYALVNATNANENTASGYSSLWADTSGSDNSAAGAYALELNTTGDDNTASGYGSLEKNTTGSFNTAGGEEALQQNTAGAYNTATGQAALAGNTNGGYNTATGEAALLSNTSGSNNTANGQAALRDNTTGLGNTGDGQTALFSNTTGSYNIGLGFQAGANITNGSYNIDIGNAGAAADSNIIRIGTSGVQSNAFIAGQIAGDGSGLTNMNFSQLSNGTISVAQLPAAVITNGAANVTLGGAFSGDGSGLGNLPPVTLASNVVAGINITNAGTTGETATNLNIVSGNGRGLTNTFNGTTNATLPIASTGVTNTATKYGVALMTATSSTFTIYDGAGNALCTNSTSLSGPPATLSIPLGPNAKITAASGLSGFLIFP